MLRLERKYLVPYYLMDALRARVMPFVRPDIYGVSEGKEIKPEYIVRSIYFDSITLNSYYEKTEGLIQRKKYRIRGYGNYEEKKEIAFEIKKKIENRIKKHRAFAWFENTPELLETGDIDKYVMDGRYGSSIEDAQRFFFHIKKNNYRPTSKVVYDREAYHGKFDAGIRVTFDKNIRSQNYPFIDNLFSDDGLTHIFKGHFILEIKYFTHTMPVWARSLIQEFCLRHEALSKYVLGFDAAKSYLMQKVV